MLPVAYDLHIIHINHYRAYEYLLILSSFFSFPECPIRITEKSFVRQYLDAPSFSRALAQLHMKDLTKHRSHRNENEINDSSYNYNGIDLMRNQFHVPEENVEDPCVSRYQLARIKHSQTFSGVYLLQVFIYQCIVNINALITLM